MKRIGGEMYVKEPATPRSVAIGYCIWEIGFAVTPAHEDKIIKHKEGYTIPLYTAFYVHGGNVIMAKYTQFEVGTLELDKELKVIKCTSNAEIDKVIKKHKLEFIEDLIVGLEKMKSDILAIDV